MSGIPEYKKVVVFSSDDQYAQHTGVALCSLLENTNAPKDFEVYIIDFGIKEENKGNLEMISQQYQNPLHYITIEQKLLENVQVQHRKHISKAAFGKFMIPKLLDDRVKKAIFLDSDVVVVDDIQKMFDTDISQYLLGAVVNPFSNRYEELGLGSPLSYFNSGVLFLNLENLRKFSAPTKVLEFLVNNKEKIIGAEQDALNAVFRERWFSLHPRWNLQTKLFNNLGRAKELFGKDILDEVLKNPAIIHYSTSSKPWQFTYKHALKHYYYTYLEKTPWKNYIPPDKNLKNIIKMSLKHWVGFGKIR